MKHTDGPWFSKQDKIYSATQRTEHKSSTTIALTWDCTKESYANARLMSAAPELLEQVKQALKFCRSEGIDPTWECALEKIIAKAEGSEL